MKEYLPEGSITESKEEAKRRALFASRVKELMLNKGFDSFINFLLDISNFNGNNYTDDTRLSAYLEGRRSVFFDVLEILEDADPTFYPQLLLKKSLEYKNAERIDDNYARNDTHNSDERANDDPGDEYIDDIGDGYPDDSTQSGY